MMDFETSEYVNAIADHLAKCTKDELEVLRRSFFSSRSRSSLWPDAQWVRLFKAEYKRRNEQ